MSVIVTTFLVVRHAESEANHGGYFASQTDSVLTERGRTQAARLAEALATARIDAVYTSDLSRARETARPIAESRGLPLIETELLRERDMGEFTLKPFGAVRETYPELWARIMARDPEAAPPGGESPAALSARVARFTDTLLANHAGQTVVLASHGGTIQHLVRLLLGVRDLAVPLWVQTSNAGVTRIEAHAVEGSPVATRLMYANRVLASDDAPMPF